MLRKYFTPAALILIATFVSACGNVGDAPEAKTGEAVAVAEATGGEYRIDTTRSTIGWKAAKVTRAHDGGFKQFDGTVSVTGDNVTALRLTMQTASIWADDERLTGHLKSDDFFKVEEFPTATFEADSFVPTDSAGATHIVTGNLMLLGATRSVVFPATVTVSDSEVKATGDFIINRKDWGIVYTGAPDDLIRDDVRLLLDITAAKSVPVAVP